MCLHQTVRTACLLGFAIFCSLPGIVLADEISTWNTLSANERQQILSAVDTEQFKGAIGQKFSAITGLRNVPQAALTDRLYRDQQSGQDSGLRLVWQGASNLISVSDAGLSLTRRF
jgi:predicted Fe-S protein YdhL (DUF1289 family)